MYDVEDKKDLMENIILAGVEVWNEVEDPDIRRGAALTVGKLLFPDEEDEAIKVWLAEALIRGSEGYW